MDNLSRSVVRNSLSERVPSSTKNRAVADTVLPNMGQDVKISLASIGHPGQNRVSPFSVEWGEMGRREAGSSGQGPLHAIPPLAAGSDRAGCDPERSSHGGRTTSAASPGAGRLAAQTDRHRRTGRRRGAGFETNPPTGGAKNPLTGRCERRALAVSLLADQGLHKAHILVGRNVE
jgi:hypothetical protein